MPRLRRSECSGPGLDASVAAGGSRTYDARGRRVTDDETLTRIRALAIPPAWQDVWICPHPNGHIQAIGNEPPAGGSTATTTRGGSRRDRREVRVDGRLRRGRFPTSHERPSRRTAPTREPARGSGCSRGAIRLLDRGFFRIGAEEYADENETYGLATMRKEHVHAPRAKTRGLRLPGEGGRTPIVQSVVDQAVHRLVAQLKRRRGGGDELLALPEQPPLARRALGDINATCGAAAATRAKRIRTCRTSPAPARARNSGWYRYCCRAGATSTPVACSAVEEVASVPRRTRLPAAGIASRRSAGRSTASPRGVDVSKPRSRPLETRQPHATRRRGGGPRAARRLR